MNYVGLQEKSGSMGLFKYLACGKQPKYRRKNKQWIMKQGQDRQYEQWHYKERYLWHCAREYTKFKDNYSDVFFMTTP